MSILFERILPLLYQNAEGFYPFCRAFFTRGNFSYIFRDDLLTLPKTLCYNDSEMRRALKAYSGKENYHGKEKDQSDYLERIQT